MTSTPTEPRIGHAERERTVELLQAAYAEGRLDHDEIDTRLQLAMTAKTATDLRAVLTDLDPSAVPATRPVAAPYPVAPSNEEKLHGALAQATSIVPIVVLPAVILAKSRSPYVRHHAAGALNLQLTLLLVTAVTFGLGGFLYGFTWIVALVAGIMALTGSPVRYPCVPKLFGKKGPIPT